MKRTTSYWLAVLGALFLTIHTAQAQTKRNEVFCLILKARGEVWRSTGEKAPKQAATIQDRLTPGSLVGTGNDGEAILMTSAGKRFRLLRKTIVRVESDGIRVVTGKLVPLENVPPQALEAIGDVPADELWRVGYPVKGGSEEAVSPCCDEAIHLGPVKILFPMSKGRLYEVALLDEKGDVLFQTNVKDGPAEFPKDLLKPGGLYRWVSTPAEGAGLEPENKMRIVDFRVLSAEEETTVSKLRSDAEASKDPSLYVLLASYEAAAHLYRDACADLDKAEALSGPIDGAEKCKKDLGCETRWR